MLVIRRRAGEALLVNSDIEIRVLDLTPSRVTLGILARPEIPVLRKEVAELADHNRQAAASAARVELGEVLRRLPRPAASSQAG